MLCDDLEEWNVGRGGRLKREEIFIYAAAASLQSCPTLCNPIDGSPPGSSVPGILQARTLEWVAISFSNAWKWIVKVKSLSHARLLATPWTGAYQAPPSMRFSRQEYWSGVPLPSPNWSIETSIKLNYQQLKLSMINKKNNRMRVSGTAKLIELFLILAL